jgi:phage I-like protein
MKRVRVCLDVNEFRVVWNVVVYDEYGNILEIKFFKLKEDAEDYADSIRGER